MASEKPAYQILFSIPQIKSALLMGPEGGGQLKIEFDQSSRAAIVAILDRATARGGCLFAGAIIEVEPEKDATEEEKHGLAKWHRTD